MTGSNSSPRRKGSGINFVFPSATGVTTSSADEDKIVPPAGARNAPRTGVGLLATAAFEKQALDDRIEALSGQVERLKAERGGQRLDPQLIVPGRWANRHPDAFGGTTWEEFKREIADSDGNVEAIKVRPLAGRRGDGEPRYEVVFGHRRHRACLELGLPVLTVVDDLDDSTVFVQMERENRGRENLSAYEQGRMYVRALDEGLFPSMRALATAIGRDASDVSKAMRIARLPEEVIGAFPSPLEIQFRWASNLERALTKDQDAVLRAAREAGQVRSTLTAGQVFDRLIACLKSVEADVGRSHTEPREWLLGNGVKARVRVEKGGGTTIQFDPGTLPPTRWDDLEAALKRLFK
jgi:ParB family chromosome partitioning protein